MAHKQAQHLTAGEVYVSEDSGTEYRIVSARPRKHLIVLELVRIKDDREAVVPFLPTGMVEVKS